MLIEILKTFSEERLIRFLPKGALEFLRTLGYQEFDRDKICNAIACASADEFVFNKELRSELINSLTPEHLVSLFPELNVQSKDVMPKHYKAVVSLAEDNEYQLILAQRLGIGESSIFDGDYNYKKISRIQPNYAFYPYQESLIKSVVNDFKTNNRVLLHLPTGAGKTRTAMGIVCEHLRKSKNNLVLWLADREELCSQAFNEFEKAWRSHGSYDCSVYGFYSDSRESLSGIDSGVIVASLQTFHSIRNKDIRHINLLYSQLRKKVTLVVFDEAHKAVAGTYKKVTEDFMNDENFTTKLLGLTATPGRVFNNIKLEKENIRLASFFNSHKVSMQISGYLSPIDYLVNEGYLAKANFISLNYIHSEVLGYSVRDQTITQTFNVLSESPERNKVLIDVIKQEVELGKQVIVFACSVKHARLLSIALNSIGIMAASIDSGGGSGSISKPRRTIIQKYKEKEIDVLLNYGVLTAGFDAPNTSVSIIARPTNSLVEYLQMAGRAMRGPLSGGNNECWIYSVIDNIPEFQSVGIAFEHWNEMWRD